MLPPPQFGAQEPGSNSQIKAFARNNYGECCTPGLAQHTPACNLRPPPGPEHWASRSMPGLGQHTPACNLRPPPGPEHWAWRSILGPWQ